MLRKGHAKDRSKRKRKRKPTHPGGGLVRRRSRVPEMAVCIGKAMRTTPES